MKSINEVDSEASTEVYISNILPDSLAARDGRLRQGDQILQVSTLGRRCLSVSCFLVYTLKGDADDDDLCMRAHIVD